MKTVLAALIGLCLLAGLFPAYWHAFRKSPFPEEERALRRILRRYPELRVKSIGVLNAQEATKEDRRGWPDSTTSCRGALRANLSCRDADISSLMQLRREIKTDPLLANSFANHITFSGGGWRIAGTGPDDDWYDFEFLFLWTEN